METIKNILIITPFYYPNIGGVESHLSDLVTALSNKGYRIFVHTYTPLTTNTKAPLFENPSDNIFIFRYYLPGHGLFHLLEKYPLLDFIYLTPKLLIHLLLWFITKRPKIDVIHAHGLNACLIGVVLKKIFNIKLVVSIHAVYEFNIKSITSFATKQILKLSDSVITLSKASQKQLSKIGVKSLIFKYWIDLSLFKKKSKKHDPFTVLFVGRLIPKKGIYLIIKLAKNLPQINFIIIGDGPLNNYLNRISISNLKFLGAIPNKFLPKEYHKADLLIIPSMYPEGFGRVTMEAVACGLPVVGSNLGGIPEALDESVAILVKPSYFNFYKAINFLLKNKNVLIKLKSNTRLYAEKNFSIKNLEMITNQYL